MPPLEPPPPAVLTEDQANWIGKPPKPFEPIVGIVEADGRPTAEFHLFLLKQYEWERRLYAVLTGVG